MNFVVPVERSAMRVACGARCRLVELILSRRHRCPHVAVVFVESNPDTLSDAQFTGFIPQVAGSIWKGQSSLAGELTFRANRYGGDS